MASRQPRLHTVFAIGLLTFTLVGCNDGATTSAPPPLEPIPGATITASPAPADPLLTAPAPLATPGTLAAGELLSPEHLSSDEAADYFAVESISDEVFARMYGLSWREGAPPIDHLRYLRTLYTGFDGQTYIGEMVVAASVADGVLEVFEELYAAEYQIELMVLVDNFDADDMASIASNNTSAFNYRLIAGTNTLSNHGKGLAIDLNPWQNPWVRDGQADPEGSQAYVDRDSGLPHMIDHSDLAFQLFTQHGWSWGGDWIRPIDYQHFETGGSPTASY